MPAYPPEIYRKAAEAVERELMSDISYDMHLDSEEAIARAVLDAVAADLGNAVAEKILARMEANGPGMHVKLKGDAAVRRLMRRQHFATAARIAARAFLTEEDTLRQVAEAVARGDYVACPAPEDQP